jgi:homoserine O-acetyltransferase
MPELRLHYATVGASSGEPVVILYGTMGSGTGMLSPTFAGELFGPGQSTRPKALSQSCALNPIGI